MRKKATDTPQPKNRAREGAPPLIHMNQSPEEESYEVLGEMAERGAHKASGKNFSQRWRSMPADFDSLIDKLAGWYDTMQKLDLEFDTLPALIEQSAREWNLLQEQGTADPNNRSEVPAQKRITEIRQQKANAVLAIETLWKESWVLRHTVAWEVRKDIDLAEHSDRLFGGRLHRAQDICYAIQTLASWREEWERRRKKTRKTIDPLTPIPEPEKRR